LLHNSKIAILLVALFSLTTADVFATTTTGPGASQLRNNSAGNEISSPDQQSQPRNGKRNIQLISSSSYKDSIGSLHVIGEIQNTSPDPREYVKIVSTLHDPSGSILDTSFTYSEVEVLRPGENSPFDVIFGNEQQVQMSHRYEISSITSDISQAKPVNLKLNFGNSYYDSIGSAHIIGEVTNNGPGISHFTKISGTFYDDQNKTVATGFTYTDPKDLESGQSAPFDMIISDDTSANIASGSLNVQSSEFAMILPAVAFQMDGQSDGDSSGESGSLGGGSINGSPDEGDEGNDGNGDDGGDVGDGDDGGNDSDGGDNEDNDSGDGNGEDGSDGNDNGDGNSDNNGEFFGGDSFF
jgi:hypothetical protein